MSKVNPKPKNRKPNKTIENLIDFVESTSKDFTTSSTFVRQYHEGSKEDHLTEILLWHYIEENKQHDDKYVFMPQANQENRRKVDIGIGLHGGCGDYIFCIEAKYLPAAEYVTTNNGAIKRFKKCQHGLSTSNPDIRKPLAYNGIIAYVKSGIFEDHFIRINEKIKKLSDKHSHNPDKFDLTWNDSEHLRKIYFESIAKLFSKHPRQNASDVCLYHFWIYVK